MTIKKIEKKSIDLRFIKQLREDKGYSQANVASILGFKSPDKYTRRENGIYNFQADELQVLSELYRVPMKNFFTSSVRKSNRNIKEAIK